MDKLLRFIFGLPVIRKIKMPYQKKKELFLYLVFGVLTTVVSIILFWFFDSVIGMHELIANSLSWIFSVAFAFFTNRIWVFAAPTKTMYAFFKQMGLFYSGRLISFGVETLIIWIFVTLLGLNALLIKIIANVIVIIINYVMSKIVIFRHPVEKKEVLDNDEAAG